MVDQTIKVDEGIGGPNLGTLIISRARKLLSVGTVRRLILQKSVQESIEGPRGEGRS